MTNRKHVKTVIAALAVCPMLFNVVLAAWGSILYRADARHMEIAQKVLGPLVPTYMMSNDIAAADEPTSQLKRLGDLEIAMPLSGQVAFGLKGKCLVIDGESWGLHELQYALPPSLRARNSEQANVAVIVRRSSDAIRIGVITNRHRFVADFQGPSKYQEARDYVLRGYLASSEAGAAQTTLPTHPREPKNDARVIVLDRANKCLHPVQAKLPGNLQPQAAADVDRIAWIEADRMVLLDNSKNWLWTYDIAGDEYAYLAELSRGLANLTEIDPAPFASLSLADPVAAILSPLGQTGRPRSPGQAETPSPRARLGLTGAAPGSKRAIGTPGEIRANAVKARLATANALADSGDLVAAIRACDEVLGEDPDNRDAGQLRTAVRAAIANRVAARSSRAEELFRLGQLPDALRECDGALQLDPQNGPAQALRAKIARALEILGRN